MGQGWARATDVTQPGWYWLRRGGSLTVVQVIAVPGYEQRHWIVEGVNLRWSLGNMDGEFLGPISLDSYKQGRVAGARDYKDTIIKELDLDNSKQQEFTRTDVILALAHADDTLAQQAQEGGVGDGQ